MQQRIATQKGDDLPSGVKAPSDQQIEATFSQLLSELVKQLEAV
jgi:hypothetical protein